MSDQIIDIETLLAPVSEENPTGAELSVYDAAFDSAKTAFDNSRNSVKQEQAKLLSGGIDSQGKPWGPIDPPEWEKVIALTSSTLAGVSKDFRLAGWLAEALLRKHGLAGLSDGLTLCKGLCERYWENIRPSATKEDGHGVTTNAFASLVSDSTLPAIRGTVLVEGTKANERSPRRYTAFDFSSAKEAKGRVAGPDETIVEMSEFMAIAEITSAEFHAKNLAVVNSCISTLDWLGDFLRTNCLPDEYGESTYPGVSDMKTELEKVKRMVGELSGGTAVGADGSEVVGAGTEATQTQSNSSEKMTRESAFRTIEEIARFFERTEPHTPVHFALRKVVRWGRMPLPQLLAELIEDLGTMESVRKLIGLPEEIPKDS